MRLMHETTVMNLCEACLSKQSSASTFTDALLVVSLNREEGRKKQEVIAVCTIHMWHSYSKIFNS